MLTSTLLAATLLAPVSKPVEVPFRVGDNAIIADAIVNGKKVSCMFDTGFSGSFVLSDNVNIGEPSGQMMLRDFVGQFAASTVPIKTLKMGSVNIRPDDMAAVQQPGQSYSLSYNTHTVGIMGMEVMRDFVLEINMERRVFIFHPQTFDITTRTPDNKRTFLVKMKPKGQNSIELKVEAKNGETMNLALDTGNAFYATTHKDVLERIGLWPQGKKPNFMGTAFVASGPVDSWYLAMQDLKIFGVSVPNSVWSIIDLPSSSSDHDGTVGFGFLKNFNTIIDLRRRRVWLENWTGKVSEPPVAAPGISAWFFPDQERFVITSVTPGSPADRAGIRRGDFLLGVDGNELLDVGGRGLQTLLEGQQGSTVKLVTSRGGVLQRYELKREYLINGELPKTTATPQTAASPASSGQ